jgi:hypothetical protein
MAGISAEGGHSDCPKSGPARDIGGLTPEETRDLLAPRFIFPALRSSAFCIAIIFAAVTTIKHLGRRLDSTKKCEAARSATKTVRRWSHLSRASLRRPTGYNLPRI